MVYWLCHWKLQKANPGNLELAGFYWVAEEANQQQDLVKDVADYTNEKRRKALLDPLFNSDGFHEWKALGFDQAFYQPTTSLVKIGPYRRLRRPVKMPWSTGEHGDGIWRSRFSENMAGDIVWRITFGYSTNIRCGTGWKLPIIKGRCLLQAVPFRRSAKIISYTCNWLRS